MSASPEYSIAPFWVHLHSNVVDREKSTLMIEDRYYSECMTPAAKEFKLPLVPRSCPWAPRKPEQAIRCKRKLISEFEFVVVKQEEMESLFRRRGDEENVPPQLLKKKKRFNGE